MSFNLVDYKAIAYLEETVMPIRAIKIIKRENNESLDQKTTTVSTAKTEADAERGIVNAVSNWIVERKETGRSEKQFSDDKIVAWNLVPKDVSGSFR